MLTGILPEMWMLWAMRQSSRSWRCIGSPCSVRHAIAPWRISSTVDGTMGRSVDSCAASKRFTASMSACACSKRCINSSRISSNMRFRSARISIVPPIFACAIDRTLCQFRLIIVTPVGLEPTISTQRKSIPFHRRGHGWRGRRDSNPYSGDASTVP